MKAALLVSTYNNPDALELTLLSVMKQSLLPDEILIADDGSRDDTRQLLEKYAEKFAELDCALRHIWHDDKGFRLSAIRNRALAACKSEYVIQIDGDVLLHEHFVQEHVGFSEEGYFICGRRANINAEATQEILKSRMIPASFSSDQLLPGRYVSYRPYLTFLFQKQYAKSYRRGVLGSNMSYWLSDAKAVNGYNEAFEGWGKEDNEFVLRLLNLGRRRRTLAYCALQYHLFHQENARAQHSENEEKLRQVLERKIVRCERGIKELGNR